MNNLKELEAQYKRLGEEIERRKSRKIDFRKIPVDTLVEVSGGEEFTIIRYFSYYNDGAYYCFEDGRTSKTESASLLWRRIRLLENEPKAWFGGKCPLPDGVEVTVWHREGGFYRSTLPFIAASDWQHNRNGGDIIAYQIHESEWQN